MGWASRPGLTGLGPLRPSSWPPSPGVAFRIFYILPLPRVGPCRQFLSELDEAPGLARFGTFLARSSEFVIFSGLVLGLLGVVFTSLLDMYRASRSCHEVFNELFPKVSLLMLKSRINTKLQNRHAQVNLSYHVG
jgi:hypothetical protein